MDIYKALSFGEKLSKGMALLLTVLCIKSYLSIDEYWYSKGMEIGIIFSMILMGLLYASSEFKKMNKKLKGIKDDKI